MGQFLFAQKQLNQQLLEKKSEPMPLTFGEEALVLYRKVLTAPGNKEISGQVYWLCRSSNRLKLGHSVLLFDIGGHSDDTILLGLALHLGVPTWPKANDEGEVACIYELGLASIRRSTLEQNEISCTLLGKVFFHTIEEIEKIGDDVYHGLVERNGGSKNWCAILNCRTYVKAICHEILAESEDMISSPTEYTPFVWNNAILPMMLTKEKAKLLLGL